MILLVLKLATLKTKLKQDAQQNDTLGYQCDHEVDDDDDEGLYFLTR